MNVCYCTAPATVGHLCTAHAEGLRQDLRRSVETLRELDVTITNQARQGGATGGGERFAFNVSASDVREDVMVVLRSAAHLAAPGARYRYDERPAHLVARAWTLPGFKQLCRAEGVHTVAQDLRDVLGAAERVMRPAEERFTYGVCLCGARVTAPRWAEVTTCRACGRVLDLVDWRERMEDEAWARLPEMTGTPKECVEILALAGHRVSWSTVRRWVSEGRLVPVSERGGKRYKVRDVAELAGAQLTAGGQ